MITLFSIFWYPYKISFIIDDDSFIFDLLIINIFLNLVVSLNRAQIFKGKIVKDRMKLLKLYIGDYFVKDVI